MNILAYLFQIAKSLSLNYIKKNKRFIRLEDEDNIIYEREHTQELEDSKIVQVMKKVLNDNEFQIVILHVVNEMTHKEISELLNKPLGTITWAYNNAIAKVRREIE